MEGGIEFATFYNTIDIDCVGTSVWKVHNKMDWFPNSVWFWSVNISSVYTKYYPEIGRAV